MDLLASNDFGARDFDGKGARQIHNHLFPGANTALPTFQGDDAGRRGAREVPRGQEGPGRHLRPPRGGRDRRQAARPAPARGSHARSRAASTWSRSWCGRSASAIRFTQGTVDSNEIWVELIAQPGRPGRSAGRAASGRTARSIPTRISSTSTCSTATATGSTAATRRTSSSRSTTSRSPRAPGQVVHFGLEVPAGRDRADHARGQGQLSQVRPQVHGLRLRQGEGARAAGHRDGQRPGPAPGRGRTGRRATSPRRSRRPGSAGMTTASACCSKAATKGGQKGELKQAEEVFRKVAELGRADGWVNLARVYQREGRIPDALAALEKAATHKEPAAPWVINWLTGQINARNGQLDEAIASFEAVLDDPDPRAEVRLQPRLRGDQRAGARCSTPRRGLEPVKSPERKEWLKKAIAAYPPHPGDRLRGRRRPITGLAWPSAIPPGARSSSRRGRLGRGRPGQGRRPGRAAQARGRDRRPQGVRGRARRSGRWSWRGMVGRFMKGERPRFQSRLEPLHELAETLGPVWEREPDADVQAALGRALEVDSQGAPRAAQARRDGRGPGVRDRPQERPGGQHERPVDRDPSRCTGPVRPGSTAPTPDDRRPSRSTPSTDAGDRADRTRPTATPRRVENDDASTTRISQAPGPARAGVLLLAAAGCGRQPRRPSIAEAVAPVRPAEVKAETLPAVKFVDDHQGGGHPLRPRQRRLRREAPARDDGRGRRVPRLRQRRRPGPALRQLLPLAGARDESPRAHAGPLPQRRQGALRGRDQGRPGSTRPSTARASPWATTTTTATPTSTSRPSAAAICSATTARGTSRTSPRRPTPRAPTAGSPARRSSTSTTTATSTCSSATTSPGRPRSTRSRASSSRAWAGRTARRPRSTGRSAALLRNDGGRFTDISEESGIQVRTPDLKVPDGQGAGRRPVRRRRRRPGRHRRGQRHGAELPLPQQGQGQVRGDRDPLGSRLRPVGLAPRGHGLRLGLLPATTSGSAWPSATSPTR